ncbi:MAG: hypothetical protein K2O08_00275 [Clostridia bacterium]|nr:hypothetical protein [Clostridia bacterium]
MQKMLIQLDVEKIERDDKYDINRMWKLIDEVFIKHKCDKEKKIDGSIMYLGKPENDSNFGIFSSAYLILRQKRWFFENVKVWHWYDNDDDETLPYQDMDCLADAKKELGKSFVLRG